jgi:hypothetical protein
MRLVPHSGPIPRPERQAKERKPLGRGSGLKRETGLKPSAKRPKRTPLGHASADQKAKVEREGPRLIVKENAFTSHDEMVAHLDPAHVTPRAIGGCDHEDCIVPLSRAQHRRYDNGELDLLPYLTLEEQAHAVSHLGIVGALKRTTGEQYIPESEADRRIEAVYREAGA